MTRLAGVSKGLVGAEGIHLAVANIPPDALLVHIIMLIVNPQYMCLRVKEGF